MKKVLLIVVGIMVLTTSFRAFAEDGYPDEMMDKIMAMKADAELKKDMPASIPGAKVVSTADALKMLKEKKVVFLDNRIKTQYDTEHIAGAKLFFCDTLMDKPETAKTLDKDKEYLVYCNGTHCWRSPAVAMMLSHLGFKNLYWYRDGIPAWKKAGNPVE
jgi:rhodanese-related sulfurtransferase